MFCHDRTAYHLNDTSDQPPLFEMTTNNCTIEEVMQPNSDQQRGLQVPSSRSTVIPPASRTAAADLMREQIEKLYAEPQPNEQIATAATSDESTTTPSDDNTGYFRTHDNQTDIAAGQQSAALQAHWQKYHSAWQQYYQLYYSRYYQAQAQKQLTAHAEQQKQSEKISLAAQFPPDESLTKDQAVSEVRSELLKKIRHHTKKIRSSRHFMPTVVSVIVALSFLFVQYNQILLANIMSFTTPSMSESLNNYIDPSTDVRVGPEPLLKIPKIGVEAPVIYDVTSLNESVIEDKLRGGVVHYPIQGANALPGQTGNTVILGHSANDVFTPGDYKFVFLRLDKLEKGDTFYLNYNSKRYTYVVTEKRVISPKQVDQLASVNNGKPLATLVTCTPVGTSTNRLLVIGEQIAPDSTKATAAPVAAQAPTTDNIGGGTKSFLERLFGGN